MANSIDDPIVITGCGWVTPFAAGTIPEVLGAAGDLAPPSGEPGSFHGVPEKILVDYPALTDECKSDKGVWLAAIALEHARRDAALSADSIAADRTGMVLGCALAGQLGMIDFAEDVRQQSMRFVSPIRFPQTVGNYIAGALARAYDIRGPNMTIACGTASGQEAIVEGWALLSTGAADVVFAGGSERPSAALAQGLSEAGRVLTEGACLFALERGSDAVRRGARVLATIAPPANDQGHLESPAEAGDAPGVIVSTAGFPKPGAVFVEHWTGHCLSASGAAAVAAGIAATRGLAVPWIEPADGNSVSIRPASKQKLRSTRQDGTVEVWAITEADGVAFRSIRLLV